MEKIRPVRLAYPCPDVDARIISLEDEVTALGDLEKGGELVVKAPNIMKGYHNMPTETQNSLRDGWLYTGDIAKMDEDGFFYIVDRKKELIKPGGYQVWPREVEEVIAQKIQKCLRSALRESRTPTVARRLSRVLLLKPGVKRLVRKRSKIGAARQDR